jgi:RimJ/RimL family protein N-acetyltransferase
MFPIEIVGKKITLRLLDSKYFEEYHRMFSKIVRVALGLPETATLEETKTFLTKKFEDLKNGEKSKNNNFEYKVFYCIFDNSDKKLIGAIEIRELGNKDGQLGTWLNENYWGSGRYQEALDLILKNYFKFHDFDSLNAYVRVVNIRSLKAHQKYGFEIINELEINGNNCKEIVIKRDKVLGG